MDSPNLNISKVTSSLGHRRQASQGLGIITSLETSDNSTSKNAAFFGTTDTPTPAPPPRLSPLMNRNGGPLLKQHTSLEPATAYADRLRNRAPSMINNPVQTKAKNFTTLSDTPAQSKVRRARSYRSKPSYEESKDDDDGIMPLPSPVPTCATPTSSALIDRLPHELHILHPVHHHRLPDRPIHSSNVSLSSSSSSTSSGDTFSNRQVQAASVLTGTSGITSPHSPVTPPSPTPSTATSIPIIAISPIFVHDNDVIPRLSDHPLLGDIDTVPSQESPVQHHKSSAILIQDRQQQGIMVRESGLPHSHDNSANEEDLVGKQLGNYAIRRLLGTGAFSKVYLAERHQHQQVDLFAIKTINKSSMVKNARFRSSIEREVAILKLIDHPHIVRIEATMETEHSVCIILEYAKGVELFDFVQTQHAKKVEEDLVKQIFLQLVGVVQWMHQHNIVHRDLKLENILIRRDDQGGPILKVTDFGLARVIDPDSPILTTRCGSEEYAAPEIVQSKGYDGRLTDTWALGIILYALLVGYLPFRYDAIKGERVTQMFYRIVRAQVKWPKTWDQHPPLAASTQAKQVVERILVRQPDQRIPLDDIGALPWFQQQQH